MQIEFARNGVTVGVGKPAGVEMAKAKRRVAIIIAVSDARPLAFLQGALNGARDFAAWANSMGYETFPVTDADGTSVDIPRLRQAFDAALTPRPDDDPSTGPPIDRLILYFAGHGLIREAEEGLWLLSDWRRELRAVAVEQLRRRLYAYGVKQIAIFADACRELPANISIGDLATDPVLGAGPYPVLRAPHIDKYVAAQDGADAYMVPADDDEQTRCLFSAVLLEGLWGAPAAMSQLAKGKVTSGSLGAFLEATVPEVASRYALTLAPSVARGFPDLEDIYFDSASGVTAPTFPPWPPAPGGGDRGLEPGERSVVGGPTARGFAPAEPARPPSDALLPPALVARLRREPAPGSSTASLLVDGVVICRLWTRSGPPPAHDDGNDAWRIAFEASNGDPRAAPLLLECADGQFSGVVAIPGLVSTVLQDDRGAVATAYRHLMTESEFAPGYTEQVIAEMEAGTLRADSAIDHAVRLRAEKHSNPVLGVVSAYLYDAIGDVESIRRLAYYYIANGQPIPYDVALLAMAPAYWRDDQLWVEIPEIPRTAPRTELERKYGWAYGKTPGGRGLVGGLWPWMRQGWGFLDDPMDVERSLIRPGLADLGRHLQRSRFTTLDRQGGEALAALFGFQPSTGR